MPTIEQVLSVLGAVSALCTVLAPLFPAGSRVGKALARIGADIKGHNK